MESDWRGVGQSHKHKVCPLICVGSAHCSQRSPWPANVLFDDAEWHRFAGVFKQNIFMKKKNPALSTLAYILSFARNKEKPECRAHLCGSV